MAPAALPVPADGMLHYATAYLRWLRCEVTLRFVEGYLATLHHSRKLKASSVNRALYAIKGFFRYLAPSGFL